VAAASKTEGKVSVKRRAYATDEAFRIALEERVKAAAKAQGHLDATRQRQLLLADRYLARIATELGNSVVAKGGIALELRLPQARATQDLDIHVSGSTDRLLDRLQAAGRIDLADRLRFDISTDADDLRTIEGDGVLYEGFRFRVSAILAGRQYGDRFGLDVIFGERIQGADELEGLALLEFAGIPRARHHLYPRELHVAEKLHAYTMPRPTPNGRVKDLPDLALLGATGPFDAEAIRTAIERTFEQRKTHPVPLALPPAPVGWAVPYARLARINRLPWPTVESALAKAGGFLEPVLAGTNGTWSVQQWQWFQHGS